MYCHTQRESRKYFEKRIKNESFSDGYAISFHEESGKKDKTLLELFNPTLGSKKDDYFDREYKNYE